MTRSGISVKSPRVPANSAIGNAGGAMSIAPGNEKRQLRSNLAKYEAITLHRAAGASIGSVTQKKTGWISPEAAASAPEEDDEEEVSESVGGVEF